MKSNVVRILAVAFSVTLVAGLMYYRTGGRLFADPTPEEQEDVMMGGSKSAKVFLFDGKQTFASPAESSTGVPPDVLVPDDEGSSFSGGINQQGSTPDLNFSSTKWGTMIHPEDVQKAIAGKRGEK